MKEDVIICGDCLEVMADMPDNSVDLVLTDLPYGTTGNKWDSILPLDKLWKIWKRICKGGFICTASQPFTTMLIASNMTDFKYCWVWNKCLAGNGILAKIQPLKIHEDICVFGNVRYVPQKRVGKERYKGGIKDRHGTFNKAEAPIVWNNEYYPTSILKISAAKRIGRVHPTEKPVALMHYLVRTYSKENNIILDCCAGGGSTLVAAKMLGRHYIGIDISEKYCEIARKRIEAAEKGITVKELERGQGVLF